MHAEPVGRQAEVRIAPTAHAGGGKEPVLERQIGHCAPAGLAHGGALHTPAGQTVDTLVGGHAGRQKFELVAPAQESLEPRSAQGHPDRTHAKAQAARDVVGGALWRRAGDAGHV